MVSETERITNLEAKMAKTREVWEATRQENALQFEQLRKAISDLSRAISKRGGKKAKSGSKSLSDEDEFDGRKKNHDKGKGKGSLRDYPKLKMPVFEGNDAHRWIYRGERYFAVQGIEEGRFKKLETVIDPARSALKKQHTERMELQQLLPQQTQHSRPPPAPKMAMPASTNDTQPLILSSGLVFDEHELPILPFQEANSEKVGRRLIAGPNDTKPVIMATMVSKGKENKEERENGKKVLLIEEKRSSIGRKRSSKDIVDEGGDQATNILSADQSEKFGFHLGPDPTQPNGDFLYFFYPP